MAVHDYTLNFQHDSPTQLGLLHNSSYLRYNSEFADVPLRLMGSYCLAVILDGSGLYRDANGRRAEVQEGTAILAFPGLAVRYCPPKNHTWYELNVLFSGPIFDLLRERGILDDARPVITLDCFEGWHEKLRDILCRSCESGADRLVQLSDFASFLVEMHAKNVDIVVDQSESGSIRRASRKLQHDIGERMNLHDLSTDVGLSYESFRKRFAKETGLSPARFRAEKRIEAAKDLLATSQMNCKEIAATIGYASEFYFSRKFKKATGLSPTAFRASNRK